MPNIENILDYKAIFEAIENTLFYEKDEYRIELGKVKEYGFQNLSDEDFFEKLLVVTFASGFKAATMHKYHGGLRKYFPNIETAINYTEQDLESISKSGEVIGHLGKLRACVKNAKEIRSISSQYGSVKNYITETFELLNDFYNMMLLNEVLRSKFGYLGEVTVYHLMTDMGLPVIKPDRVIMRIFERLGLVENRRMFLHALKVAGEFSKVTNYSMRYIDLVFVSYGQVETWNKNKGICLEENPECEICKAKNFCKYYKDKN